MKESKPSIKKIVLSLTLFALITSVTAAIGWLTRELMDAKQTISELESNLRTSVDLANKNKDLYTFTSIEIQGKLDSCVESLEQMEKLKSKGKK